MEILEATKEPQIINLSLAVLDKREAELVELKSKYEGLTINGIEDTEGYDKVDEARKELKSVRVQITNDAKELRDPLVKMQKTIIAREGKLIDIIEPLEKTLHGKTKVIDEERARIKAEEDRKQAEKINRRISALNALNYGVDIQVITSVSDEKFDEILAEAKTEFEKAEAKRKEEVRLMEIERQKEEERQAEIRRLEKIKRDQELKELELKERQLEREREQFRFEQEAKQKKLEEEQQKIREENERKEKEANERQAELDRKEKEILAKIHEEEEKRKQAIIERLKKEEETKTSRILSLQKFGFTLPNSDSIGIISEDAFQNILSKAKHDYEVKEERLIKEQEEEKLKFGEDSDRFSNLNESFVSITNVLTTTHEHMKSEQGKKVFSEIETLVYQAAALCKRHSKEMEKCR